MPDSNHGRFVWYELLTTDPEAAAGFYTHLFGWGTETMTVEKEPYTVFTAGGAPHGGMLQKPPGAEGPPSWLGYVAVEDVDAAARRAEERGATIHVPPRDIPTVGRFAVLADPQGAMFALYRSSNPQPSRDPGEGNVSWHELATTDAGAAWRFYSELFGWAPAGEFDMGEAGMYSMFGYDGPPPLGAVYPKPAEMPGPPAWTYYVSVSDLDGKAEKVKERGGRILMGPMEVPGGDRIATFADPQGAVLAMHERKS
ncbi:MAG TPA: VOC family protein [Thermoanaerobaculia bacterium]|nr:VOC family protein [Thermoanaerobaculia bacterium]